MRAQWVYVSVLFLLCCSPVLSPRPVAPAPPPIDREPTPAPISADPISAVIPLRHVPLAGSGVVMSMPHALVEVRLEQGRSQRLSVRRPLEFEVEMPNNALPWVVRGPFRDAGGVLDVGDGCLPASSVSLVEGTLLVDVEMESLVLHDVEVPRASLDLRSPDETTYFWDDTALFFWGREGYERLALRYLRRPAGDPAWPSGAMATVEAARLPWRAGPVAQPAGSEMRMSVRQIHLPDPPITTGVQGTSRGSSVCPRPGPPP